MNVRPVSAKIEPTSRVIQSEFIRLGETIKSASKNITLYKPLLRSVCEKSLLNNIEMIKEKTEGRKICAVLKGDAYGHDIETVGKIIEPYVDCYGVTENDEALVLRSVVKSSKPIIRVRVATPNEIFMARKQSLNIEETITTLSQARHISDHSSGDKTYNVHIALNAASFGKEGFNFKNGEVVEKEDLVEISTLKNINVVGVYSHLPKAHRENIEDSFNDISNFVSAKEEIKNIFGSEIDVHLLASASTMRSEQVPSKYKQHLTMDRIAAALYGHLSYPGAESLKLKDVMTISTEIADLISRPYGATIGYDGLYKVGSTSGESFALLPFGWNVLPMDLLLPDEATGETDFLLYSSQGTQHRVIGDPSMNSIMCRVTSECGTYELKRDDDLFIIFGFEKVSEILNQTSSTLGRKIGCGGARIPSQVSMSGRSNVVKI